MISDVELLWGFVLSAGLFIETETWDSQNTGYVKKETERQMKAGKPGGSFIMQPVDFLEYGTPENNIEAYVKTAREFGIY